MLHPEECIAFGIDDHQLQLMGGVAADQSGDGALEPLALSAAGGACDEQVRAIGIGEIEAVQFTVEVESEWDHGAAEEWIGRWDLGLDRGEVDVLAILALQVDDEPALDHMDQWPGVESESHLNLLRALDDVFDFYAAAWTDREAQEGRTDDGWAVEFSVDVVFVERIDQALAQRSVLLGLRLSARWVGRLKLGR